MLTFADCWVVFILLGKFHLGHALNMPLFLLSLQAELTFMYQKVWDPRNQKLVPATPYAPDIDPSTLDFAGP
jgi:hypothetical protein